MRIRMAALIYALLLSTSLLAAQNSPAPPAQANQTTQPAANTPVSQGQGVTSNGGQEAEQTDSRMHDELIAREQALAVAERKHDRNFFASTLADDVVYVVFNGWVFTKEKLLSGIDGLQVESVDMKNFKFIPLGNAAGLLTYDLIMKATLDGHDLPGRNYAASVWENRGGHWQLVFHQVTPAHHP